MTTTYLFNKANRVSLMSMRRHAISIIQSFFAKYQAIVGKPVFTVTTDQVLVQIFYYGPKVNLTDTNIASLGDALTRCWGRTVELRLIRLNHATLDSSIFAQYLTANSNQYSLNSMLDMIKNNLSTVVTDGSLQSTNSVLPGSASLSQESPVAHITGIKVKLSGRLTTQRSGPRQTVQAGRIGSSAKGSYGTVNYSQHTAKNKLGAFTMKVWISQQSR